MMKQNRWNKVLSLGMTVLLTAGLVPVQASDTGFADVPVSHWAADVISRARQEGWINGLADGSFHPEEQVTVPQWLAMLSRAVYSDQTYEAQPGAWYDGYWYEPWLSAADANHLSDYCPGLTGERQLQGNLCARSDMAAVIRKVLENNGQVPTAEQLSGIRALIPDLTSGNSPVQEENILVPYYYGILKGADATGAFHGEETISRAQAAAVLCRLADVLSTVPESGEQSIGRGELRNDPNAVPCHIYCHSTKSFSRIASTGVWTGDRPGNKRGYIVQNMEQAQAAIEDAVDRGITTVVMFSPDQIKELCGLDKLQIYEAPGSLSNSLQAMELMEFCPVQPGVTSYRSQTAGDYYEYRLDLVYSPAYHVRRCLRGESDNLTAWVDFYFIDSSADMSALTPEEAKEVQELLHPIHEDYTLLYQEAKNIMETTGLTDDSSDYEKVSAIYEYVTSNFSYDYDLADRRTSHTNLSDFSKYPEPCMLNRTLSLRMAVCDSMSRLFEELCHIFDVPCLRVSGDAGGAHAWNMVQVDGSWYQADVTWDLGRAPGTYRYFLISTERMEYTHTMKDGYPDCPNSYSER